MTTASTVRRFYHFSETNKMCEIPTESFVEPYIGVSLGDVIQIVCPSLFFPVAPIRAQIPLKINASLFMIFLVLLMFFQILPFYLFFSIM